MVLESQLALLNRRPRPLGERQQWNLRWVVLVLR